MPLRLFILAFALVLVTGAGARAANPPDGPGADDVAFEADRVTQDTANGRVILSGNVRITYREVEIKAGHVVYDRQRKEITAGPLIDDAGNATGLPEFTRANEHFKADRMVYDLAADRGRVWGGKAVSRDVYRIRGEHVLLDSLQNVHLRDISMTTCDAEHVHYHFQARRLKIVENDRAIARGVTFELGPLPFFWFPFYVFPLEQGRRSGILTPNIGNNSRDGIVVNNLGYYFAPNDYWDATISTAVRERGGILLDGRLRYAVRNRLNGNVDAAFENYDTSAGTTTRSWRLNFSHYQRLSPSSNLRASGSFTNNRSFDARNSDNLYNVLNRQLRSSLSLDKRWRESGRSVDASLTFLRDLERSRNDYRGFPRLTFRQGRKRIFGGDASTTGAGTTSPSARPWYQAIYYSLSADLDNAFVTDAADSLETENLNVGGALSINSQHRPFGFLELTPSFTTTQRLSRNDQDRPTRTENYTGRVSTGTTLYGFFYPSVGRLRGIRHRFQPRVDFSYSQGAEVAGGTFGFGGTRTAGDARRSATFNLTNAFDIKTQGNDGRERRATLLTANASTGIDFDAALRRVRPLRTSLSVKPTSRLDLRFDTTHNLYDLDGNYTPLDPRLTNLSVTTNIRLSGRTAGIDARSGGRLDGLDGYSPSTSDFGIERGLYDQPGTAGDPWRLNVSHHYASTRTGTVTSRKSWVKLDLGLSPTRTFRLDYSINVDLVDPDITAQTISAYRQLHCFEARLSVYPNGYNRGFAFRINIRDIPQFGYTHRQGRVYDL